MIFTQGCETEKEKLEGKVGLAFIVASYDLAKATGKDPNDVMRAYREKPAKLFETALECGIEPMSSFGIK